jgi:MoaA/NifB/PqqE/SkfB family radical SAM enzyme
MRDSSNELTTEEWKGILDECREMGVLTVALSGGEPLLRGDLCELIAYARALGLLTRISTNGQLVTRERVAELKRAGLTQCAVSIDSPDPATHDRLRGVPGAYEKAVEGIHNLQRAGIITQIFTYAAHRSIPDGLKDIIELARELGCMSVYMMLPMASGHWLERYDEALSHEEREQMRALQGFRRAHVEIPTQNSLCCACARRIFAVDAHGNASVCLSVPYPLGNVREHSLRDIWACNSRVLELKYRGACPMNAPEGRKALQEHAERVARALASEGPPRSAVSGCAR